MADVEAERLCLCLCLRLRLCCASEASHLSMRVILGYYVKSDLNFNPLHFSGPDTPI
jgi:hypothetical protein